MAKFRMVYTEFWTDPNVIEEMTPEDKYFFLYILTNPKTTQIGIYEITKKQISFDMGYSLESIDSLFDRFINYHKLIKYNEKTRELAIKNWGKFNLTRGGKPMLDCVKSELAVVKDISLIEYVAQGIVRQDIKSIYDAYHDTSTTSGQYKEEEKEEEEYKDKEEYKDMSQQSCNDEEPSNPDLEFDENSTEIQLARFMISEMLKVKPDSKVPKDDVKSLQSWAKQIDYIIRLDKREPRAIAELFRWAQENEFWCSNIRSPQKLRKQWDALELQRNRKSSPKGKVNKNLSKLEEMYQKALAEEGGE